MHPRSTRLSFLGHTLCLCLQCCTHNQAKSPCGSCTLRAAGSPGVFRREGPHSFACSGIIAKCDGSLRRVHSVKLKGFDATGKTKNSKVAIHRRMHVEILQLLLMLENSTLLCTSHLLLASSHYCSDPCSQDPLVHYSSGVSVSSLRRLLIFPLPFLWACHPFVFPLHPPFSGSVC